MAGAMVCVICKTRRARRGCPAVHGEICTICCGEQRETALLCPLDCEYLQEAHKREKTLEIPDIEISNRDIEIHEDFVVAHDDLMGYGILHAVRAALETPGAVDDDLLLALDAIIKTMRTAAAGLVYETRAGNHVAWAVQQKIQRAMNEYEEGLRTDGLEDVPVKDRDKLKILVFLHRVGQQNQNGRPKGRMFIGMLQSMVPMAEERGGSSIIL